LRYKLVGSFKSSRLSFGNQDWRYCIGTIFFKPLPETGEDGHEEDEDENEDEEGKIEDLNILEAEDKEDKEGE